VTAPREPSLAPVGANTRDAQVEPSSRKNNCADRRSLHSENHTCTTATKISEGSWLWVAPGPDRPSPLVQT